MIPANYPLARNIARKVLLCEELFDDGELIQSVVDELCDYVNVVLIKSIVLHEEYRGKGLGGILALAIAERFGERDIVALKPWPLAPDDPDNRAGFWKLPRLTKKDQKNIAAKFRKNYMSAGFKPLFRGSSHLFLTHLRHSTATQLIDEWNDLSAGSDNAEPFPRNI